MLVFLLGCGLGGWSYSNSLALTVGPTLAQGISLKGPWVGPSASLKGYYINSACFGGGV